MQIKLVDIEPRPVWVTCYPRSPVIYYRAILPARVTGGTVKSQISAWADNSSETLDLCGKGFQSRIERCHTLTISGFGTPTIIPAGQFGPGSDLLKALASVPGVVLDWDDNYMATGTKDRSAEREELMRLLMTAIVTGDCSGLESGIAGFPWLKSMGGRQFKRIVDDFHALFRQQPDELRAEAVIIIREKISALWAGTPADDVDADSAKHAALCAETLRGAWRLIASTDALAEVMVDAAPNADIRVAPNAIDPADFPRTPKPNDGIVRIGYAATPLHLTDAPLVLSTLKACAGLPNTEVWFFGWHPNWSYDLCAERPKVLEFEGMPYHHGGWIDGIQQFHQKSGVLDIALAPLQDTAYTRCKSPQKWFEAAANATAMVVSDSPVYACAKHGVTGFKARDGEDFYEYATQLCRDAELRKRIGGAAHDYVMAHHTTTDCAEQWRAAVGVREGSRGAADMG